MTFRRHVTIMRSTACNKDLEMDSEHSERPHSSEIVYFVHSSVLQFCPSFCFPPTHFILLFHTFLSSYNVVNWHNLHLIMVTCRC